MVIHETKQPTAGIKLARALAEQGFRLFTNDEARQVFQGLGMRDSYLNQALHHLNKGGWIEQIRQGLYALNSIFLQGNPIHEFEIATHLVEGAVISHFSAFHHYGYTDQIPQTTYATVQTGSLLPRSKKGQRLKIWGTTYHYSQIKEEHFFGHTQIWIGDMKVAITDRERTLIDGLIKPGNCGGFREVLEAYKNHLSTMSIDRLIEYALKLDISVSKRLGWTLDEMNVDQDKIKPLQGRPYKGYCKLDPSGSNHGSYNKEWQIRENI